MIAVKLIQRRPLLFNNKIQDDYLGLIELTQAMNARYSNRTEIQKIAQSTLCKSMLRNYTNSSCTSFSDHVSFHFVVSLFPSWLPGQFAILFAKPFPEVNPVQFPRPTKV